MVVFNYKGKDFYMDNRLDKDLRTKIYPDLMKNDKDNVFLVDGNEGSGKSKFADIMGAHAGLHMNCHYDLDCVCLSPEQFRNRIQTCPKRTVVIYDEAHRGMGSRRALSEINNILIDLMMEMRQKNLFVIIVMPTFFLLDKYAALFRSRGLFHIYEKKRKRGFWVFFNEKNKKLLYILGKKLLSYDVMKYPRYRGRFYDQYSMDEDEYRSKKMQVFQQKPSITKAEDFKRQRDLILKAWYKDIGVSMLQFTKKVKKAGVKLERTQLTNITKDNPTDEDGIDTENLTEGEEDLPENAE